MAKPKFSLSNQNNHRVKKGILIIAPIGMILLIIHFCTWYRYTAALDEKAKTWYQTEYLNKTFKGIIKSIDNFEDNPYKVIIGINDGSEFGMTYGVTCVDYFFNNFVSVGDSVFKESGSKYVKFCQSNNQCQDFELNFCSRIK